MPRSTNGQGTNQRGVSTHLAVAQRLVEKGYEVLQPFDTSLAYDLAFVAHTSNGWFRSAKPVLYRVQCKTAHLSTDNRYGGGKGCICINAYSSGGRLPGNRRGYWGRADYIAAYSHDTKKVYLIPVMEFPDGREIRLRFEKPKNGQESGIHWAKDYEL
jgi:hypothetical protein